MKPRLLILGFSQAGKSTAAAILAELLNTKYADTSSKLIEEFAAANWLSTAEILENKDKYRMDLFKFGRAKQAVDPLWPQNVQIKDADILTGLRNPNEIQAARAIHLYDMIIWIERPGVICNATDKLSPVDADVVIQNDGTIADLRAKLVQLVVKFQSQL